MSSLTAITSHRGRGRPKQFDPDAALDNAMRLFWQHGYEATSLHDLVAATGAKAPTLYSAFGNKEGLFRAVVERYVERYARRARRCLNDPERTITDATRDFINASVVQFTGDNVPPGCFLICTSSDLSAASEPVAQMLHDHQRLPELMLGDFYRTRQALGEMPEQTDTARLAKYLACIIQGMAVQARDGVSRQQLFALTITVMTLWPQLSRLGAAGSA